MYTRMNICANVAMWKRRTAILSVIDERKRCPSLSSINFVSFYWRKSQHAIVVCGFDETPINIP